MVDSVQVQDVTSDKPAAATLATLTSQVVG